MRTFKGFIHGGLAMLYVLELPGWLKLIALAPLALAIIYSREEKIDDQI